MCTLYIRGQCHSVMLYNSRLVDIADMFMYMYMRVYVVVDSVYDGLYFNPQPIPLYMMLRATTPHVKNPGTDELTYVLYMYTL